MVKLFAFDQNVRFLMLMKKLLAGKQINMLGIVECAPCTQKLVKDCQSEVDGKDHGQRDLTTCICEGDWAETGPKHVERVDVFRSLSILFTLN